MKNLKINWGKTHYSHFIKAVAVVVCFSLISLTISCSLSKARKSESSIYEQSIDGEIDGNDAEWEEIRETISNGNLSIVAERQFSCTESTNAGLPYLGPKTDFKIILHFSRNLVDRLKSNVLKIYIEGIARPVFADNSDNNRTFISETIFGKSFENDLADGFKNINILYPHSGKWIKTTKKAAFFFDSTPPPEPVIKSVEKESEGRYIIRFDMGDNASEDQIAEAVLLKYDGKNWKHEACQNNVASFIIMDPDVDHQVHFVDRSANRSHITVRPRDFIKCAPLDIGIEFETNSDGTIRIRDSDQHATSRGLAMTREIVGELKEKLPDRLDAIINKESEPSSKMVDRLIIKFRAEATPPVYQKATTAIRLKLSISSFFLDQPTKKGRSIRYILRESNLMDIKQGVDRVLSGSDLHREAIIGSFVDDLFIPSIEKPFIAKQDFFSSDGVRKRSRKKLLNTIYDEEITSLLDQRDRNLKIWFDARLSENRSDIVSQINKDNKRLERDVISLLRDLRESLMQQSDSIILIIDDPGDSDIRNVLKLEYKINGRSIPLSSAHVNMEKADGLFEFFLDLEQCKLFLIAEHHKSNPAVFHVSRKGNKIFLKDKDADRFLSVLKKNKDLVEKGLLCIVDGKGI